MTLGARRTFLARFHEYLATGMLAWGGDDLNWLPCSFCWCQVPCIPRTTTWPSRPARGMQGISVGFEACSATTRFFGV